MKKLLIALSLVGTLIVPTGFALADQGKDSLEINGDVRVGAHESGDDSDVGVSASTTVSGSSREDSEDVNDDGGKSRDASSTDTEELSPEAHKSSIAAFVQALVHDADRDGGIGEDVRAVARSQGDSASTTAEAIAKVNARNTLLEFLVGTDWDSLGKVRSQVETDANDIQHLQAAAASSTDASVKADLEAQIQALKDEQAKLDAFVSLHENVFSLFGWFTKLFASVSTSS